MPQDGIVIWGVESSFASELVETVDALGLELIAGVLVNEPMWNLRGVPVVLNILEVTPRLAARPAAIAYITPLKRQDLAQRAATLGVSRFAQLIDPTARKSPSAAVGQGFYMGAGSILGAGVTCAKGVTVNRSATVGHHTTLEDYVSIGPGVTVASHCEIGRGTLIGAGATVAPGRRVGANSVVGAGAVVLRDVEENTVVIGNPARVAKSGSQQTGEGET